MGFEVAASGKKAAKVRPTINVTPLVDVVLVLLIIFMVITPMMKKQFSLHVPKADQNAQQEDQPDDGPPPVVVSVRVDGSIWINRDRVTEAELSERLRRIFAARAERLVFFDADDNVPYGRAMEVLDTARSGSAQHIAVLTDATQ